MFCVIVFYACFTANAPHAKNYSQNNRILRTVSCPWCLSWLRSVARPSVFFQANWKLIQISVALPLDATALRQTPYGVVFVWFKRLKIQVRGKIQKFTIWNYINYKYYIKIKKRAKPSPKVQKPTKKHSKPTKINLLYADKAYF